MNGWITVLGIVFIFFSTALGSAAVYCFKGDLPPKLQAAIFGFAAGVMLAASVWSLLLPALSQAENAWGNYALFPISVGFLLGGALIVGFDCILHYKINPSGALADGRARKLFLSMTLHNIPEGLAVGFAFGGAYVLGTSAAYWTSLGLAFGIGIQNFPEGAAVTLTIKSSLGNPHKAFLFGVISAVVEPIFAVIGYFFAAGLQFLQPWLLAFSAGAMIFVVAEELLPESQRNASGSIGAWGAMLGFVVMMALDVLLG